MTPKLYVDEGKGDGEAPARRGVGRWSAFSFRIRRKDEVGLVVVKYVYGLKMTLYVKINYWYKAFFEYVHVQKKVKILHLLTEKIKQ